MYNICADHVHTTRWHALAEVLGIVAVGFAVLTPDVHTTPKVAYHLSGRRAVCESIVFTLLLRSPTH